MRLSPRLLRAHPAFFIILFFTAVFNLLMGLALWIDQERFSGPSQEKMYDHVSMEAWGVGHFIAFALITIGVYKEWTLTRLGLLVGFFLCFMRGWLQEQADIASAGAIVWICIAAACHFAQLYDRRPPTY